MELVGEKEGEMQTDRDRGRNREIKTEMDKKGEE